MAIGTAYIKIMPEANGISNEIAGIVDPSADKAGKSGGNKWVSAFKKVLAGAAVGKWIGDSILAGADLEQALGGIETLYKDASDKMKAYASQAYKTAGIDATTYMEQATSFSAALIKSYNGDVDAAADATNQAMIDMADNASKMGTPLESLQMAYQSMARGQFTLLDNLKIGYGGTRAEAERMLKDAEKLTGIHYDINELGDVYEAIHVIQTEMGITGTTAEEASETISGSIGMVKASYKDFVANLALGNDIYPQLEALVKSVGTMLKNVLPAIANVVIGIPKVIIKNFPAIRAGIANAINQGVNYIKANWGLWVRAVVQIVSKVGTSIIQNMPTIIAKVKQVLTNAINAIRAAMPAIITAVLTIVKNIGVTLITNLPSILRSVLNLALSIIKSGLNLAWTTVKSVISGIISTVGSLGSAVVSRIRSGLASVVSTITSPFTNAWNKVKEAVNKIKNIFPLRLGKIFDGIKLPHFKISGGKIPWGIGGAGQKPSVSVEWYAQGGIMTRPTLFGGGEAGAEAIMPLDPFWAKLDRMADGIYQMADGQGMTVNVYGTAGMDVNELADAVERRIIEAQNRRRLAWR